MTLRRIVLSHDRNVASLLPLRFAKSAARTYAISCRPRASVALSQPTRWVRIAAITPLRAFVPYAALPVRA